MKHPWPSYVISVTCIVVLTSAVSKADTEDDGKLLKQVQQATNADDLSDVYEKACKNASKEELDRLKTCRHSGVAIQAAWEEVRRTIPAHVREGKPVPSIDPKALQHFLGFVEGRLRVRQPKWWRDGIAEAGYQFGTADDMGRMVLTMPPDDFYAFTDDDFQLPVVQSPVGTSVAKTRDGGLRVAKGRDTFDISKSLIERAKASFGGTVVTDVVCEDINVVPVDAERFIVAFYNVLPDEYPLFCVNRSSGQIIWEARVWAECPVGIALGGGVKCHAVEMRIADGVVYVFGLWDYSAYLEAFSLADGKNQFRFSTSY